MENVPATWNTHGRTPSHDRRGGADAFTRRDDDDQAAVRMAVGRCNPAFRSIACRRTGTAAGGDQVGPVQFRAAWVGGLQRTAHVDRSKHGAVLAAGDDVRWRRPDDVRPAGPAGTRGAARRTGSGAVEPRPWRSRRRRNAHTDDRRDPVTRPRDFLAHARHSRAERGREGQQRRRDERHAAGQRAGRRIRCPGQRARQGKAQRR